MVNRRAFLRALLTLPIAATFDIEKLLWVPGQMVVVPPTYGHVHITIDELDAVALRMLVPIADSFFKADPSLAKLKDHTRVRFNDRSIDVPITYQRYER